MRNIEVKNTNKQIRKLIEEVFSENDTLTIATSDKNAPWVVTLVYAFDGDFNLYFVSEKKSLHSKQLGANPVVAVAVHDKTGKMKGVQIQGKAFLVPKSKIPSALKLFWRRFPWAKTWVVSPKQLFSLAFKDAMYMVKPLKIYLLNKEKFGSDTRYCLGSN